MMKVLAAVGIALAVMVGTFGKAATREEPGSPPATTHRVHVFYVGAVCYVNPAHLSVAYGDTIVWRDLTGKNVGIFFPRPLAPRREVIRLGARQTTDALVVNRETARPGLYPYAAFCEATSTWAEGSHPMIIVDGD